MTKPILVCMSWRGGERLERCLQSIQRSEAHFDRIVISVTSEEHSADLHAARRLQEEVPRVEVLCTGRELPTMEHQAYWVDYLEGTGASPDDWIYWLAYDDEVRPRGIEHIIDRDRSWPLVAGTAYFGPWAMRHEEPERLWSGDPAAPMESWTSFPVEGPTRLTVAQWISNQLVQPTYMQMSGSVNQFRAFTHLRDAQPRKKGPMRIEMAIAADPRTTHVEEFSEPISIIYGRPNSDRANYGSAARREDLHLLAWLARHHAHHPRQAPTSAAGLARAAGQAIAAMAGGQSLPSEEWRARGEVTP